MLIGEFLQNKLSIYEDKCLCIVNINTDDLQLIPISLFSGIHMNLY